MFKKFFVATLLIYLILLSSSASYAAQSEIYRMGIFLSNFTETGLYDFDINLDGDEDILHLGNPVNVSELIRFGIVHNFINNQKSTIKKCKDQNCEYGPYIISGKAVVASVKKYFDMDIKNKSITNSSPEIYFDGENYHFDKPEDEDAPYYAEVKNVKKSGNIITMTGEIYNLKNKSDRPATFYATAKAYKYNKKNTWAILSLKLDWK